MTDDDAGTIIETAVARIGLGSPHKEQRKHIVDLGNFLAKGAVLDKIQSGIMK